MFIYMYYIYIYIYIERERDTYIYIYISRGPVLKLSRTYIILIHSLQLTRVATTYAIIYYLVSLSLSLSLIAVS